MGSGEPLIILHGIFGSSDNWVTVGKKFSERFRVYLVDQRNHGRSPHAREFNYDVLSQDLLDFMKLQNLEKAIVLGHSMGGKTAMRFALDHTEMVDKLIIVDIAPKTYDVSHDHILEGLNAIEIKTISSRGEADKQLSQYVGEAAVRQFLLKNLSRAPSGGFEWKLNLPVITSNIDKIGEEISSTGNYKKPTLFIRGEKSPYIQDKDLDLIHHLFPKAKIETIAGSGHWVHADAPDKFCQIVTNFLEANPLA